MAEASPPKQPSPSTGRGAPWRMNTTLRERNQELEKVGAPGPPAGAAAVAVPDAPSAADLQ